MKTRKTKGKDRTKCLCGNPVRPNQRNCNECHAKAQKLFRERQKVFIEVGKNILK